MNISYYVISLSSRKDRLDLFIQNIPSEIKENIVIFTAIDGKKSIIPQYWNNGPGAFGCYKSHMTILEQHINHNNNNHLCIFEDDAVFGGDFFNRTTHLINNLPNDWDQFFLGGQFHQLKPVKFDSLFYTDVPILRTHAYIINTKSCKKIYNLLQENFNDKNKNNHIDHIYANLHRDKIIKPYCPTKWLCGQRNGYSDISNETYDKNRWWNETTKKRPKDPMNDLVIVLGLHGSGSSCVATILKKLGVFMGDRTNGYYSKIFGGGGEDEDLSRICEDIIPTPETMYKLTDTEIISKLQTWITSHRNKGKQRNIVVGCKYPTLCCMHRHIKKIVDPKNIKIIHCDRDINDSINSLIKRGFDSNQAFILQNWLFANKLDFLYNMVENNILHINFNKMISDPVSIVDDIIKFLHINPTDDAKKSAIKHVKAS